MSEVQTIVMKVGMHCDGCARKVRKILNNMAGVEDLKVDYAEQKVTVKGALDPKEVVRKVSRAGKAVEILEIIPEPPKPTEAATEAAAAEPPQVQTITLKIMMHCEGCARKVKYVLRKIPGVKEVEVHFKEQKVIVRGSMDVNMVLQKASKTGKQVELWPMPPEPPKEESKEVPIEEKKDVPQEESKDGMKAEEGEAPKEEKKEEDEQNKDPPKESVGTEEPKVEESKDETKEPPKEENVDAQGDSKQEEKKVEEKNEEKVVSTQEEKIEETKEEAKDFVEEVIPSAYIVYRCDAPQIFSDDNPNACIIM